MACIAKNPYFISYRPVYIPKILYFLNKKSFSSYITSFLSTIIVHFFFFACRASVAFGLNAIGCPTISRKRISFSVSPTPTEFSQSMIRFFSFANFFKTRFLLCSDYKSSSPVNLPFLIIDTDPKLASNPKFAENRRTIKS